MLILTIRTDKPLAEIGLYSDGQKLAYDSWQAHRQLGQTIHRQIASLLEAAGYDWKDVGGLVVWRGPGSFTGLRIGLTVANTLAQEGSLPIVGITAAADTADGDEAWINAGIARLLSGESDTAVMPEYGAEANITKPRGS